MENLFDQLNGEQRRAVEQTEGPVMIIAGAGSGKTRTLTYRIAHLIEKGVDPFNILALTFTNKAAEEMKERIIGLVGSEAKSLWMGTFHSIFAKILRFEAEKIGYIPSFTIYDTDDSKNAIKQIIKGMNLDPKVYNPGFVLNRISMAKSSLLSPEDYCANTDIQQSDKFAKKPLIGEIFKNYNQRLRNSMAMDFDDLLFNTNVLLRDFPETLLKYQNKFKYILVDEYQDTNHAQYLIVKKLAARYRNICVVGDDAQSIYSFRGANIQNILNFKRDYSDVALFKLEQNYRSTKNIVQAANSIIEKNRDQIFKEVWTDKEEGNRICLLRAQNEREEASLVANSIFDHKMNGQLMSKDFAILYRTNIQSRAIEEALRKFNIPYRIYGGLSFYRRKEIKDILAYLRLVVNNHDEEALLRVINYPARGIGNSTIDRLRLIAEANNCSMFTVMDLSNTFESGISSGTVNKITDFVLMIKSCTAQLQTVNAFDLAQQIVKRSGIIRFLQDNEDPDNANRVENIEELLNAIQEFCQKEDVVFDQLTGEVPEVRTLDVFLQQVLLLTNEEDDKENTDKVSLMTIHSAKGLEFPFVYVVGMEENLFPSALSVNSRPDLEEERRLFYVAITRAETQLTLTYAETRFQYGTPSFQEPSRFLEEIDTNCIDNFHSRAKKTPQPIGNLPFFPPAKKEFSPTPNLKPFQKIQKPAISTPSNFTSSENANFVPAEISKVQAGLQVIHAKFGTGKVLNVEGEGDNRKATVFFENAGQKILILKFAKLQIVD